MRAVVGAPPFKAGGLVPPDRAAEESRCPRAQQGEVAPGEGGAEAGGGKEAGGLGDGDHSPNRHPCSFSVLFNYAIQAMFSGK